MLSSRAVKGGVTKPQARRHTSLVSDSIMLRSLTKHGCATPFAHPKYGRSKTKSISHWAASPLANTIASTTFRGTTYSSGDVVIIKQGPSPYFAVLRDFGPLDLDADDIFCFVTWLLPKSNEVPNLPLSSLTPDDFSLGPIEILAQPMSAIVAKLDFQKFIPTVAQIPVPVDFVPYSPKFSAPRTLSNPPTPSSSGQFADAAYDTNPLTPHNAYLESYLESDKFGIESEVMDAALSLELMRNNVSGDLSPRSVSVR